MNSHFWQFEARSEWTTPPSQFDPRRNRENSTARSTTGFTNSSRNNSLEVEIHRPGSRTAAIELNSTPPFHHS